MENGDDTKSEPKLIHLLVIQFTVDCSTHVRMIGWDSCFWLLVVSDCQTLWGGVAL